jgi:hypothetical protein
MKRLTITEIIKSYPIYSEGRFGCMERKNSIYFEITWSRYNFKYPIELYYEHDDDCYVETFKNINEALDYADKYFSHKKLRVGE